MLAFFLCLIFIIRFSVMTSDICKLLRNVGALDLKSNELDKATKKLAASLLDPERLAELIASLTPQAREALNALTESNGRIPYANFVRQFGDIREMGAGKRDPRTSAS